MNAKPKHTPGPWTRNDKMANYSGIENYPQAILAPGAQIMALLEAAPKRFEDA